MTRTMRLLLQANLRVHLLLFLSQTLVNMPDFECVDLGAIPLETQLYGKYAVDEPSSRVKGETPRTHRLMQIHLIHLGSLE